MSEQTKLFILKIITSKAFLAAIVGLLGLAAVALNGEKITNSQVIEMVLDVLVQAEEDKSVPETDTDTDSPSSEQEPLSRE